MAHAYEVRIKAAICWLLTGSIKEAADMAEIPERTLRDWMDKPSWDQILENAKSVKDQELDAMWTSFIHICTDEMKDRVKNGNKEVKKHTRTYYDDKTKRRVAETEYKEIRVPVELKDLAYVVATAVDRRALVRKSSPKLPEGAKPKGVDLDELGSDLAALGASNEHEKPH